MSVFRNAGLGAAAFLTASIFAGSAQAASFNCPNTVSASDREFTIVVASGTVTCMDSGNGNSLPSHSPPGYVVIDDSASTTAFVGVNGELTLSSLGGVVGATFLSGDFSFALPVGYQNAALGFQTDPNGPFNPDWVIFGLGNIISGSFSTVVDPNNNTRIANVILYAQQCPVTGCTPQGQTDVPLPAAVWLMGSVLAGGAGFGAWRRRRETRAA